MALRSTHRLAEPGRSSTSVGRCGGANACNTTASTTSCRCRLTGAGLGKPLQLINRPVRERIPITIAALGPKNVALAAEIAEGRQPGFFYPEKADAVWGETLRAGLAKRDPALGPL